MIFFVTVLQKTNFECKPMLLYFCSYASDRILRSYKRSLNGFAAKLTEQQANKLAGMVWSKTFKKY